MKHLASKQLLQVMFEDLEYLINDWPTGIMNDGEIRRSSAMLRRFCVYDDLIKVWVTIMGQTPYLLNGDYFEVDFKRLKEVDFATCCKATNLNGTIFSVQVFNKIQNDKPPISIIAGENIKLKRFLNQTSLIVNGNLINRHDLIKFVCNKMGGAHFDDNYINLSDQVINLLNDYFIGERPAIIQTMLSIGQAIANSNSTKLLYNKLHDTK